MLFITATSPSPCDCHTPPPMALAPPLSSCLSMPASLVGPALHHLSPRGKWSLSERAGDPAGCYSSFVFNFSFPCGRLSRIFNARWPVFNWGRANRNLFVPGSVLCCLQSESLPFGGGREHLLRHEENWRFDPRWARDSWGCLCSL